MMGHRQVEQATLFYEFSLERHIPTVTPIPWFPNPCCNPIIVTFVGMVLSPEGGNANPRTP